MKLDNLPKYLYAPAQFKKSNWIMRKLFGAAGSMNLMILHASDGSMVLPIWSKKSDLVKWAKWYGEDVEPMEIQKMNLSPLGKSIGKNFQLALNLEPSDLNLQPEKLITLEE